MTHDRFIASVVMAVLMMLCREWSGERDATVFAQRP
jgi:hypothetical protein